MLAYRVPATAAGLCCCPGRCFRRPCTCFRLASKVPRRPGGVLLCWRPAPFSRGVLQTSCGVFLISGGVVQKSGGVPKTLRGVLQISGGFVQKPGGVPKTLRGVLQIPGGFVLKPGGVLQTLRGFVQKLGGVVKLWRGVVQIPGGVVHGKRRDAHGRWRVIQELHRPTYRWFQ